MATFEKDVVERYGSLEKFAKADGCYRIYETDENYYTVHSPREEQVILASPYVHSPRLVWKRK
jgi:hypothetical protein